MNQYPNFYKVLQIEPTDNLKLIKDAYRKLVKLTHPDLNPDKDGSEFIELQEVFEIMKVQSNATEYLDFYNRRIKVDEEKEEKEKSKFAEELDRRYAEWLKEEEARIKREREEYAESKRKKSLKELYQEIKKEEMEDEGLFRERHYKWGKRIDYKYRFKIPRDRFEEMTLNMKKGAIHVAAEFAYQLNKLTYIKKDSLPKYVLRNRLVLGTVTAMVVGASVMSGTTTDKVDKQIAEKTNISENVIENVENTTLNEEINKVLVKTK